jgi:hypothetical protein
MFGTLPTNQCIGRADGLCPSRLARLSQSSSSVAQLQRAQRREDGVRAHLADNLADEAPSSAPAAADDVHAPPDLVTIASTALMHAVLVSWCLASSDDIVVQQRTFITHFFRDPEDVRRRAYQFLRLYTIFKEMLIAGTLRGAKNWLPKARMCVLRASTARGG